MSNLRTCQECKHQQNRQITAPCITCQSDIYHKNWEAKEMEILGLQKKPDYSFNQEIIDALRDEKTVWYCNPISEWVDVNLGTFNFIDARNIINGKWSLTKPKTMLKKQIKYWANIHNDTILSIWTSEIDAKNSSMKYLKVDAIAVPFTIEYEVES